MRATAVVSPAGFLVKRLPAALCPNAPAYDVTLRELLDAEVLRRSPEFDSRMAGIVNINQHYEVTPEGASQIAGA